MICVIALVVFAVLGLFSAKYRVIAREAFNCVFLRITLRPCTTRFDQKIKAKITAKAFRAHKGLGSFVFRHFESISWVFTILMLASFLFSALAVYNLVVYGTCDPVSNTCIFVPPEPACGSPDCLADGCKAPDFAACDGACSCEGGTCGGS